MERWYRVFGGDAPCTVEDLVTVLRAAGYEASAHVQADAAGWFRVEFTFTDGVSIALDRYRADEDGIRAELNSWAAWVETHGDDALHTRLMERLIQTAQLFMLVADSDITDRRCEVLIGFVAARTGGVYQIDGRGLFADETLIIEESEPEA